VSFEAAFEWSSSSCFNLIVDDASFIVFYIVIMKLLAQLKSKNTKFCLVTVDMPNQLIMIYQSLADCILVNWEMCQKNEKMFQLTFNKELFFNWIVFKLYQSCF